MTKSIDLANLIDLTRRDQYGRYLVVPPIGGPPEGYSRVTTIAKVLDPGGGLIPWKATMTACGMILRRGLRAQWETLIAQYDNPWYANEQTKALCKALVEECAAVGGANDRAEIGTALHAITSMVDLGRTPSHLTEETETDIAAYQSGLKAAGVVISPQHVEVTVVLDQYKVAGTFDRLASVPGFDLPLVADLKTGAELSYSWQSIAVQMAAYSRGNAIYQQGSAPDGSKDKRLPMPEVDQKNGLIIWLNAGTGTLELFLVDLEAGWEAFERSMWTRGWRNRAVSQPLGNAQLRLPTGDDSLVPVLQASIDAIVAHPTKKRGRPRKQPVVEAPTPQPEPEPEPEVSLIDVYQAEDDYNDKIRSWLQGRIDLIGRNDQARTDLIRRWPKDIPTLRGSSDHTSDQLAAIEQLLIGVEARAQLPFGEPKPEPSEQMAKLLHLFPNSTITNNNDKEPPAS
jgi:hypothetical protein